MRLGPCCIAIAHSMLTDQDIHLHTARIAQRPLSHQCLTPLPNSIASVVTPQTQKTNADRGLKYHLGYAKDFDPDVGDICEMV